MADEQINELTTQDIGATSDSKASFKNRGSSLDNKDLVENIAAPGYQHEPDEDERFEGRSPNHSFYIDHSKAAQRTAIEKDYPAPGEGSSGTGEFPPKYVDTIGVYQQRDEQRENTEEPEEE
jgi:hypothetical protein